jgi:hypothetical protein
VLLAERQRHSLRVILNASAGLVFAIKLTSGTEILSLCSASMKSSKACGCNGESTKFVLRIQDFGPTLRIASANSFILRSGFSPNALLNANSAVAGSDFSPGCTLSSVKSCVRKWAMRRSYCIGSLALLLAVGATLSASEVRAQVDLAGDAERWTMVERKRHAHPMDYALRGPSQMRVWSDVDPLTQGVLF